MGLFDWLTEAVGSGAGMTGGTPMMPGPGGMMGDMDPMGSPTGQSIPLPTAAPAPTGPMPDAQGPGMDAPMATEGAPAPPALGMMPPPPPPNPAMDGLSLPPGMGPPGMPPLPRERPPGAPMMPPPANEPPPRALAGNVPPTPPTDVSSAVRSYQAAGGNFQPPGGAEPRARSILGRAIGMDPNTESQLRGTLAGGFKAAGNSSGKSPFQAFSSGAGEGLEGGKGADDKTTKQQDDYLGRKIQAKGVEIAEGNAEVGRTLNMARTKLALEQAKMTKAGGGVAGTANSQQQLYLRGNALVNSDPEVKLAKSTYDNLLKSYAPDSPEVKAAADAHKKLVEAKRNEHLGALGIKPEDITKLGKMPGMSRENPVPAAGLTKEKFDALPPGSYFINPKDNQLLVKKGPATPAAGGNQPVAPQQQMTPAVPPVPPVTSPAGSRADNPDDD